jgi:methyltransferase (TIGR00027 family)
MGQYEQWDIVTGVGITALGVAAGRAMETKRLDSLVTDPFADGFVAAAHAPVPLPTRPTDVGDEPSANLLWTSLSAYLGVRSRFFDEYIDEATSSGVDQVVLLAAGLDTRAFRLDLPSDCDLFEVDQPKVLQFKDTVLDDQGARPQCNRRTVAVDLREDWPAALRETGFDPGRPTAWLAEGLLPYLPAEAERELFDHIHELSAPGSRLSIEYISDDARQMLDDPQLREVGTEIGIDMSVLWHTDEKQDPRHVLRAHGWTVSVDPVTTVASDYGRELDGIMARTAEHAAFLTARR